jgi:hypothetical protein
MANPVINPMQKESFSICDKDYLEDKIEILGASASCKMCSGLSLSHSLLPTALPVPAELGCLARPQ